MAKSFNSIKAGWKNPESETIGKRKNFKDIKSADYNFGVDESRINSFLESSKRYFDNIESETSSVNFKNANSKYSSNRDILQSLGDEARTIRAYYNANKSKIDEDTYKNMLSNLDLFETNSSSVLDFYRQKADAYSKFETEAEYNDAVKVSELYNLPSAEIEKQMGFSSETYETDLATLKEEYDKLNKDIQFYSRGDKSRFASSKDYNDAKIRRDELKKQMTDLKGKNGVAYTTSSGQNITWKSLYDQKKAEEELNALHSELSSAEDWWKGIETSQKLKNPTPSEAEGWITIAGESPFGKKIQNKLTYAKENKMDIEFARANGSDVGDLHLYLMMNEAEEEVYNYYLYKGGEGKAEEFFESIKDSLAKRSEDKELEAFARITENTYVLPEVFSVATSVLSGGEYIADAVRGDIGDTNHMANVSSTIRGTRMEQIDWEVGDWDAFDFLYGTGMSMADSVVAHAMFGKFGGVALGLSAAAQGTNDALNRGMSKGQAFASGVASGIFEGIFESWSFGAFDDLTKNLKRADFRNLAKYVGKNMWNNAKEETLTEIANIAYDYLANGDFSQVETAIRQYVNSGMSEADAKRQVAIELGGQIAEAGGSGALMGFGFGVGGSVGAVKKTTQSGKLIKDAGETRNLVDLGKSLGEGTESYKLADKITDKSSAYAIGKLYGIEADDIANANKGDLIKAFEEKGFNSKEANALVNKMFEEGVDSVSNIRGMLSPTQVYNDVLNDPNSTVSQREEAYRGILQGVAENRLQKAISKAVKNKSAIATQKTSAEEQGNLPTQEENPVESKFESNPEGRDFNTSSGKIITSKKLVASNKDNMAFEVTYDDGTTENVDANDISFGNEGEALVYSAVMNMNLPVGVAEQLISGYNGNDVNSAGTYINGVREAFVFGKHNQEADLHNGAYASQLTEEQRSNAFKLGKIYANEKAIADEKAIKGETKPTDIKKQEGKVHFEGDKLSLKSVQDVSIETLGVLTKAIGKDIHIFESYVDKNGNRVYKDANGNIKKAPNGFYRQLDGSIWIDLNAGNRGQGVMMYTVAHELTHFIKQWSPTKFKALADFLVEQYGKEGVSVHQLVLAQQKKAKDNGRNISYDVAFEEMVADSMETMLTDGKVIRELAHKDKGLFDKIKSWIDNLLRRLNKEYKNYSPETEEGQMLREMKKTFEEAQRLFTDALTDASDNFAIRGTDVGFIQKNMITGTGKLAGIMDSTRTETEAMPKMVMDMSSGNGGKLFTDLATNYLIKGIGNGGAVNGYTVAQIREAIMKANGFDAKQIRNVQAFMKSMVDFMDEAGVKYRFIGLKDVENAKLHYSYNADGSIKSVVLSAMVKNGDYPVNFDFSSICKKRVAMSKLINKLCDMGAMDKGTVNLSPKNIFEINKALKNEGFETACLGCFVESKRYNIQEWANSFIKKWNEAVLKVNPNATYFGFTDGKTNFDNLTSNQVFAIDKAAQNFLNKTGQERRNKAKAVYEEKAKNGEALLEKLPKSAITKIKKSQSLDDSMKDYFLSTDPKAFTLADVELLIDNEILAGKSISNKQKITKMVESGEQFQHLLRPSDLLTERGITQLEQLPNFHGILYGHYGSGTPKLVQGFTPYNSEIALLSDKKGDKTLAEYLYSIAGVRMQSFSDFQIQNIFDYLQMIADLSARKLPAHAYTKEISFAKLLGMTGIKTNLSVMFDIDTSVDDAHAGLTKYNPAIHQGEYAKIVLEDEQGKWVYNIGDYATQKAYEDYAKMMGNEPVKRFLQSIGFADAVKLQTTEGYTKNCGIIGVGYSDAHILAMLDDSRIRYVIPYHSSSLPHEIKVATNIEKGTDYTSTQNTMKIVRITDKNGKVVDWSIKEAYKRLNSGKAVIEELNKHIKEDGWVVETKKAQNGHGTFDLYGDLSNTSDPRMTADNFMSWCAKNGSLPLFYQFANHNNYYKMLYDFNVYDNVTEEYAPQGAVTNTYPTGVNVGADVVSGEFNDAFFKETVEHYMQVQNDFNARLDGTIDELADKIVNNTMPDADFGVMNSLRGVNKDGIEVYETSDETMALTWDERIDEFEKYFNGQFANKTARFVRNGHTYYAEFDKDFFGKVMYGEDGFSPKGKKALIRAGADGDIFDLVENATYTRSDVDTKNHKKKDGFTEYFDYFYKTVQIDNRVYDICVNVKKKYGTKYGYTYTMYLMDNKKIKASPVVYTQSVLKMTADASNQSLPQDTTESQELCSLRTKNPPKTVDKAYKLFDVDENGMPHALFIDKANALKLNTWYDADSPLIKDMESLEEGYTYYIDKDGNATQKSYTNKKQSPSKEEMNEAAENGGRYIYVGTYKNGSKSYANWGVNGSGSVTTFAMRPGWHMTDIPAARHIGKGRNGAEAIYRRPNQRWFEVEYPTDVDYHEEASQNPSGDIADHIPTDGWYSFKTNTNASGDQNWIITGAVKIVRPLSEAETHKIAKEKGVAEDLPYENGYKAFSEDDTISYSDRVLMGSLFSGGGTLEAGLVYQMLDKEFAVEFNKQIASVYTDNHGKEHMFVGDVRDFNSKEKRNVFYLHASPVCKNFSSASHSGGETTLDITTAQATARVLEEQMPQLFTVENVKRYIGSEAYNIITNKLDELGYTWDVDVYKASNYGNATKRERMIIRAVKSGELPTKPQKVSNITSWGEATRDLWETDLIPSNLVRSKIEAIKNTPGLKGVKLTKLDKPLLIYDTTKGKQVTYAWADELAPTLTTKCGDARIIMPDGRVYAPTPKFMGRIQGLPDNYKYPKATTRAFTIIGNGIPTQLTKAVMGGVLDSAYEQTHNGDILYSERDTESVSTRSLLANALESVAENDIERNKLAQYKEKIELIEAEQKKLHELREKLFTKGIKGDERREIQEEATRTANRINTYDRQLFNLESTTALKNVLNREKELARKRQKQKDAENLKAYKEKVAETTRQLLDKNRESRERAVEGRNKTEMRHKVKKVVNDLNNLLLKPTKERHIPEEMRIAVAEALDIVNMDTVDAETRVAHYNDLIAKANDPDVIASLTETRDRILNQGNKLGEKLAKLKEAYATINASADDNLKSMYDDVIYSKIESVQKKVGKTPLRNMTLEQLESVYELYKMVLTTVRDSNKAFAEDLKMTRQALGSNTFAEIKENNKARDRIKFESIEKFGWKNLKPMQAMKTIGSSILQQLWNNILYGQEVFAQDYDEAVKFAKEMKEKYGYNKWDLDKLYSFESKSGKVMKINLEQMMSIYAYSKRKQADEHIEKGGILLNESIIKEKKLGRTVEVKVNDSTAYRLDKLQVEKIIDTLEKKFPGAKDFVDEMQGYLSVVMGEKGNEVSMKMYGIKLFKEEHYFPLKSSKDFMESANAKLKGDVKIKNKGMTKATVEHASNPIVLEGFLDVWGNHVNEMSMYHGLVLPLEDFSRTLNYGFKADDKANTDAESVRTALRAVFGESADNYLNELLKAINGGVLYDSSTELADKMVSKFKKAKVMASLSVIVQQPTAIIRAMGIIEPKYFASQNFHHKQTWEELKKYCPTAIIKETGSFDTNMGRTIVDMIKEDRTFTEKVGDTLGKAPAWMDEMGWNMIWRALKKKVATEQNLSGEALLQECGKQMTLIINETQVYDSVMSRNELMRSKSALTKMATAFMGEPSTVANMIYGAVLDFKRGKKGIAGKTVAAVISSVVINGLVSSLVYALRDDDEDKTFLEKYLSSSTTEVLDGLNPLTYIPVVKDVYSLFQGYDVERTDMALIGDFVDAIDDFYNLLDPEAYEDMSGGEIAKHIYESAKPLLTSICDMFGLPVGNILRDAEAIIVNDNLSMSKTSGEGLGLAVKEGWLNASPEIVEKFVGDEKYHKLYLIANNGDTAYVKNEVAEMVAEKFDSYKDEEETTEKAEKKAKQSVKSSFTGVYRDEYKRAFKNKDSKEMNEIRKFLYATGLWDSLTELDNLLANWRKAD